MSARHVLTALVALITLPAADARAAVTLWTEVPVRVYDTTGTSAAERRTSLDVAGSIVSAVAVNVIWRVCDQQGKGQRAKGKGEGSKGKGEVKGTCDSPLNPRELALRIIRSPVPNNYRGDLPLGDALIDTRVGAGVLATVYLDRVTWIAQQTHADRSVLLGRAIAHELGHLLMATSGHGTGGLMRAVWSRGELRHGQTSDWMFTQADAAAIAARARRWPSLVGAMREPGISDAPRSRCR